MVTLLLNILFTLQNHIPKRSSVRIANNILSLFDVICFIVELPNSGIFITLGQPTGKYMLLFHINILVDKFMYHILKFETF